MLLPYPVACCRACPSRNARSMKSSRVGGLATVQLLESHSTLDLPKVIILFFFPECLRGHVLTGNNSTSIVKRDHAICRYPVAPYRPTLAPENCMDGYLGSWRSPQSTALHTQYSTHMHVLAIRMEDHFYPGSGHLHSQGAGWTNKAHMCMVIQFLHVHGEL